MRRPGSAALRRSHAFGETRVPGGGSCTTASVFRRRPAVLSDWRRSDCRDRSHDYLEAFSLTSVDDLNEHDQPGAGKRDPGRQVLAVVGGDEPDEKHATFRLVGERLEPEVITRATGLSPDRVVRKGDPVLSRGEVVSLRRVGVWWIDSARGLPRTGNHLEDHVRWLLDLLEPVGDVLRRLSVEHGLSADIGGRAWRTAAGPVWRCPNR